MDHVPNKMAKNEYGKMGKNMQEEESSPTIAPDKEAALFRLD
jgi:hypothetical protein